MWWVLGGSGKHLPYRRRDRSFFKTPHLHPIPRHSTLKSVNTWQRFSGGLPPLYIDSLVIASAVTIPHTAQSMQGSDSWYAERSSSDMAG